MPLSSIMLYIISTCNIPYNMLILHLNINYQGFSGFRITQKNVFDKVFAKVLMVFLVNRMIFLKSILKFL